MPEKNFITRGRTQHSSSEPGNSPNRSAYLALCKITGLPDGTHGDVVFAAYEQKRDAAKAEKQRRADMRLFSTTVASATAASAGRVNGVKVLDLEEAQEAMSFGANTHHAKKRVEATEQYFGKDLRDCIIDGDLK